MKSFLLLATTGSVLGQGPRGGSAPFTVAITPLTLQFKLGERAIVHIVLKSVSPQPIVVPEERHLWRGELNYDIIVKNGDGSSVPDSDFMRRNRAYKPWNTPGHHSEIIRELKYGDEIAEDFDLNNIIKITTPGDYVVQVQRDDYQWGSLHIKSNELVVHFVP